MDKPVFYNRVRSSVFGGALKATQVEGLELIIAEADRRKLNNEYLAYVLATTAWETARTMQPVAEGYWIKNAEAWRRKNLRYYPFYGRGYVQLTWDFNYKKASDYFREVLGINVDFVKNPELAMKPEYAVVILFQGMIDGWFTSKKLATYLDGIDENEAIDLGEFRKARRIVNGTDKDDEIAALAIKFEAALRAAKRPETGSPASVPVPPVVTTPEPEKAAPATPESAPEPVPSTANIIVRIILAIIRLFLKK